MHLKQKTYSIPRGALNCCSHQYLALNLIEQVWFMSFPNIFRVKKNLSERQRWKKKEKREEDDAYSISLSNFIKCRHIVKIIILSN
jgi:hypothetical protein